MNHRRSSRPAKPPRRRTQQTQTPIPRPLCIVWTRRLRQPLAAKRTLGIRRHQRRKQERVQARSPRGTMAGNPHPPGRAGATNTARIRLQSHQPQRTRCMHQERQPIRRMRRPRVRIRRTQRTLGRSRQTRLTQRMRHQSGPTRRMLPMLPRSQPIPRTLRTWSRSRPTLPTLRTNRPPERIRCMRDMARAGKMQCSTVTRL